MFSTHIRKKEDKTEENNQFRNFCLNTIPVTHIKLKTKTKPRIKRGKRSLLFLKIILKWAQKKM